MSKTQHAPEPWHASPIGGARIISGSDGWTIAETPGASEVEKPNAERIVSCVNSCAGINPEAVPDLIKALEGVVRVADRNTVEFTAARAALAKAKTQP